MKSSHCPVTNFRFIAVLVILPLLSIHAQQPIDQQQQEECQLQPQQKIADKIKNTAFKAEASQETISSSSLIFPFTTMTASEIAATGIDKLQIDEQYHLLNWIKNKDMTLKAPIDSSIVAIKEDGKVIELENKRYFSTTSSIRKKVAQWKNGDSIQLFATSNPVWYVLKNIRTSEMVKVKIKSDRKKNIL